MSLDQAGRVIPELDHWDTATRREEGLGYRMEHLVSKDNVNAVRSRHLAASAGQAMHSASGLEAKHQSPDQS